MDSGLISVLANAGVAGVVLVLIVVGILVPKGTVDQIKADRDAFRQAWQTEHDGHDQTRAALNEAHEQARLALVTAEITRSILEDLKNGQVKPVVTSPPPEIEAR